MPCPKTEALSAFIDGQTHSRARAELARHLGGCPLCQHEWQALQALRQALQTLPSLDPGVDLVAHSSRRWPTRSRRRGWALALDWLPASLGAAAALATGVWLGGLLSAGALMAAPSVDAARALDPVAPGGLCAAAELCRPARSLR